MWYRSRKIGRRTGLSRNTSYLAEGSFQETSPLTQECGTLRGYAQPNYRSDTPAFIGTLSNEEIWAVLAYIKSFWLQELRKAQRDLTLHRQ